MLCLVEKYCCLKLINNMGVEGNGQWQIMVTTATNHCLDRGVSGLEDTIRVPGARAKAYRNK